MDGAMTQGDPSVARISPRADIHGLLARISLALVAVLATFTGLLLAVSVAAAANFSLSDKGSVDASASRQATSARHRSCIPERHFSLSQRKVQRTRGHRLRARHVCSPRGNHAVPGPSPQLGGSYPNARIAEVGLQRLGQHGGQCKEAVNIWVAIASGGAQHLGGDYLANYRYEGGTEVSRDQTVEGDIIQLNGPNGKYYYEGMHTAVVVSHAAGSDVFEVVDSNSRWDEVVREHAWNPYVTAQAHGLTVHIWRMGSAGSPESTPVSSNPPPKSTGLVFPVQNTDETPPDGVYFRNSPHTADTSRTPGLGVYMNERVQLICYGWGDAVGPYNDKLWYDVSDATRPTANGVANEGWLNAHYIADGKSANVLDAGVSVCPGYSATPGSTPPPAESTPAPTPQPPAPSPTYSETTGGVAHTWTNYSNAGGTEGPSIPSNATVQIACKVTGFRVEDGNTWWYRIASSPWSNSYYVSADAFYNNGQTSGSLIGTPFVDGAVPNC
jgi:hypothetical protein